VGRAVLDRRTIHVPDLQAEVDDYPECSAFARSLGYRTTLTVPLLRGAEAIGAIGIRRTEVRPFTDRQIELLQIFAAQAVIAIENVRLFNETKEALEQQTATAEILGVISSSPTDVQPGFEAIVQSAVRLGEAVNGGVFRFDGSLIHEAATYRMSSQHLDALRSVWPRPADRGTTTGRAILTRAVRQPGGHRHRERAVVPRARGAEPRADGGPGAADGDGRDPACYFKFADQSPACPGRRGPERGPSVWSR
jgi:two-component system, NtrC family, sensor kinase